MKRNYAKSILLALLLIFSQPLMSQPSQEKIQFKAEIGGTPSEVARLTKLISEAHAVVNHPEFEKRVRNAKIKNGKSFSYSDESGNQVFEKILEGSELGGPKDNVWQLFYEFSPKPRKCFGVGRWKKCSSWILGWTDPSIKKVFINSLPWPDRDDSGIVGTIVHEQLHKLGYGHPFNDTPTRYLSAPYAVGTIAAEIHKKYFLK